MRQPNRLPWFSRTTKTGGLSRAVNLENVMETNVLYYGDNLEILRKYIPDSSVDLVYLDPPFNSRKDYNILFRENDAQWSPAQIKAFEDTWRWDTEAEAIYQDIIINGPTKLAKLVSAMRDGIGTNDVMAYLVMMAARLIDLHRVLKPTGSLYLHCDPTASHYLKLVLDQIFGPTNFRNEIVWKRTSAHSDVVQGARHYGRIHDTILLFTKGTNPTWNTDYIPYDDEYVEQIYRYIDQDGRRYQTQPLHAAKPGGDTLYEWKGKFPPPGRYWAFSRANMENLEQQGRIVYSGKGVPRYKIYLDKSQGVPAQDVWLDVSPVHYNPKERLGYPTQKPSALLERIVKVSSNEGDIVLDPFCGCGTALVAAQKLNRKWIGIDITHLAIAVMKRRLSDHFPGIQFKVIGEPADFPSAKELAKQDRYQFQWWALSLIGARPVGDKKKGADQGIDGVIPFPDDGGAKLKRVIVQVKSGHVGVKDIRELRTVASNDAIGVLLTLEPPTQPMKTEAAEAGFYDSPLWQKKFPKLQILTIEEVLAGKQPHIPSPAPPPKAARMKQAKQANLM
ncbi:MAG: methylase domain protein [Dehalococcoidia bacterium]|nr:methylase domain protein [Dehalococcoidia bacterium]